MTVAITEKQARLHAASEAAAILVAAPLLLWVASRDRELTRGEKSSVAALAIATVLIDGSLLMRWRRR